MMVKVLTARRIQYLLLLYMKHRGQDYYDVITLSRELSLSLQQLRIHIKELNDKGFIEFIHKKPYIFKLVYVPETFLEFVKEEAVEYAK